MRTYNFIAPVYTPLSSIVFGKTLRLASSAYTKKLLDIQKLLIIGGGTGRILMELESMNFKGEITFLDSSSAMIEKARRKVKKLKVNFVCSSFQDFNGQGYDGFHMGFFLDQFPNDEMMVILNHLKKCVTPGASGAVTDFIVKPGLYYSILRWLMYRFFNLFAGVKSRSLNDWQSTLHDSGFILMDQTNYFSGRIISAYYKV